jgi:hypothetical protein
MAGRAHQLSGDLRQFLTAQQQANFDAAGSAATPATAPGAVVALYNKVKAELLP